MNYKNHIAPLKKKLKIFMLIKTFEDIEKDIVGTIELNT